METKINTLLLVNPSAKTENYGPLTPFSAIEPPLWCALLAAFARQHGITVGILDAEAEGLGVEATADRIAAANPLLTAIIVLGINPSVSSTPKMTAVGKILRSLKERAPRIKTLLGGLHPSALPARTLREEQVDYVCQGEGFSTIASVVKFLKLGGVMEDIPGLWTRSGHGPPVAVASVDSLPMAAWDLLPMEKYRCHNWQALAEPENRSPYAMIYTSLGCSFRCAFCNIHALYGRPTIRYRDAQKVAWEIRHLATTYGVRTFKFMDEMFALHPRRVMDLCDRIAALGLDLNIWAYARADTVNMEMLTKMRQAGIKWVCFGFESGAELSRRGVGKTYPTDRIKAVREMCQKADLNIIANFMVGLPDDTLESMQQTIRLAEELNFEYLNLYCVMAYPGSPLYEEAVRKGVRLPTEWADYSQFSPNFLPLPTKYVSAEEVLKFRDRAFQEYFARPQYLHMIERKFGLKARQHIEEMLKVKVKRKEPF